MLISRDLPLTLTDDHGTLWVDNADGTATNTQDENDGRPDQQWDDVAPEVRRQLHGYACRLLTLTPMCDGGEDCANFQRLTDLFNGLPA